MELFKNANEKSMPILLPSGFRQNQALISHFSIIPATGPGKAREENNGLLPEQGPLLVLSNYQKSVSSSSVGMLYQLRKIPLCLAALISSTKSRHPGRCRVGQAPEQCLARNNKTRRASCRTDARRDQNKPRSPGRSSSQIPECGPVKRPGGHAGWPCSLPCPLSGSGPRPCPWLPGPRPQLPIPARGGQGAWE